MAEGIERPDQAAELLAIGADMGQGLLFAHPLAPDAMEAFLDANGAVTAPLPAAVPGR